MNLAICMPLYSELCEQQWIRCMELENMENLKANANSRLAQSGIDEILIYVIHSEKLPYLIWAVLKWIYASIDNIDSVASTPIQQLIARGFQRVVHDAVKIILDDFTLNADIAPIQKNIEL